jgi:hypothetical protein
MHALMGLRPDHQPALLIEFGKIGDIKNGKRRIINKMFRGHSCQFYTEVRKKLIISIQRATV